MEIFNGIDLNDSFVLSWHKGINETLAQRLASGIYIYQIMIKNENNIPVFSDMKKMILLK